MPKILIYSFLPQFQTLVDQALASTRQVDFSSRPGTRVETFTVASDGVSARWSESGNTSRDRLDNAELMIEMTVGGSQILRKIQITKAEYSLVVTSLEGRILAETIVHKK